MNDKPSAGLDALIDPEIMAAIMATGRYTKRLEPSIREQLKPEQWSKYVIDMALDACKPSVRKDLLLMLLGRPIIGDIQRLRAWGFLNPDLTIKQSVIEAKLRYAECIADILDDL